jgi:hypothetical protein
LKVFHVHLSFCTLQQGKEFGLDYFLTSIAAVKAADLISLMNPLKLAALRLLGQV